MVRWEVVIVLLRRVDLMDCLIGEVMDGRVKVERDIWATEWDVEWVDRRSKAEVGGRGGGGRRVIRSGGEAWRGGDVTPRRNQKSG